VEQKIIRAGLIAYHRAMLIVFLGASFLGAALLFAIEPFAARQVLPIFGGSPSVWNASVMFFQIELLAGYIYAHVLTSRFGLRTQAVVHGLVLLVALAYPVGMSTMGSATTLPTSVGAGSVDVWLLLWMLLKSVGLPFFAVASAGPMLGLWFGRSSHRASGDPYFLYAASNTGSFVGLLAYPFVIERVLPLDGQAFWWRVGFGGFVVLLWIGAALMVRRQDTSHSPPHPHPHATPHANAGAHVGARGTRGSSPSSFSSRSRWKQWLWWVFLAYVPSSLMLGVTQYISTDLAPVPLLWVVPLGVYLLTFVAAFSRMGDAVGRIADRLWPILAVAVLAAFLLHARQPILVIVSLHLGVLVVAGCVCHSRLRADRPGVERLTEFYLALAVGGALGGVFNSLIAPLLFNDLYEYPLMIALACLAVPEPKRMRTHAHSHKSRFLGYLQQSRLIWLVPVALGAWVWFGPQVVQGMFAHGNGSLPGVYGQPGGGLGHQLELVLRVGLPVFGVYLFSARPRLFGLAVAAVFVGSVLAPVGTHVELKQRTFFGVHRVEIDKADNYRRLMNGATVHGVESLDPARKGEPLAYYHRRGPAGFVFGLQDRNKVPEFAHVAVVGLGAGSLAAYGKPGQQFDFFEIDPMVVRIAKDPRFFSFLTDCKARTRFVLGDGRRMLLAEPAHTYDIIVLDAFSSDAVPIHLLTSEAIALYARRLKPDGILLFHLSNLHLELAPFVAAACETLDDAGDHAPGLKGRGGGGGRGGMWVRVRRDIETIQDQQRTGRFASTWLVASRNGSLREMFDRDARWVTPHRAARPWTDTHADIVAALLARLDRSPEDR